MLESDMRAMLRNPVDEQDVPSLVARYNEIAGQTEERVPAEVAKIRIGQLGGLIDARIQQQKLRTEAEDLDDYRASMSTERMKIRQRRVVAAMERFDIEGELRYSKAFAPEKRRYRLVDPQTQKTLAYVDVPRSVDAPVERMIGTLVGIHEASRRFSPSARVPFIVAAGITDLAPRTSRPPTIKSDESSNAGNKPAQPAKSTTAAASKAADDTTRQKPVAVAENKPEKND